MVTKYIAGDGTGDYSVDGSEDNIPINQALSYANSYGTPEYPVTVYLRGPFTYDLDSWLLAGSNTIFTGDSTAKLKLTNNAGWANIYTSSDPGTRPVIDQLTNPISNFEIHGFEIDLNDANQSGYVRGKLNYIAMFFKYGINIKMHHMYVHDGLSDCMRMDHGNGLYFYNNDIRRMGHDGCYFLRSRNGEIYNNTTLIRTNSAHRLNNSCNFKIHDNTMSIFQAGSSIGGNPGIELEHGDVAYDMSGVEIYNNTINNPYGEGMWIIEYGTGCQQKKNLYVHDNTINAAGPITTIPYNAGISIGGWDGAVFESNVIQNCYNVGFLVYTSPASGSSTLTLRSNTITGTKETLNSTKQAWTGYGVVCPSGYNTILNCSGNVLSGNVNGNYYGNIIYSSAPTRFSDTINIQVFTEDTIGSIIPEIDTGDIKTGDPGLMIPTADGHYIFQKLSTPAAGDKVLLFPMPGDDYVLLKLATDVQVGEKVIIVPDGKGNYYAVE